MKDELILPSSDIKEKYKGDPYLNAAQVERLIDINCNSTFILYLSPQLDTIPSFSDENVIFWNYNLDLLLFHPRSDRNRRIPSAHRPLKTII